MDGVKNELVQSLFLDDLPIHTAHWGGGGQYVVAGGRRKHIYIFDLLAQKCERVQGCLGAQERSFESFVVSQDEQRPCAAFLGMSSVGGGVCIRFAAVVQPQWMHASQAMHGGLLESPARPYNGVSGATRRRQRDWGVGAVVLLC